MRINYCCQCHPQLRARPHEHGLPPQHKLSKGQYFFLRLSCFYLLLPFNSVWLNSCRLPCKSVCLCMVILTTCNTFQTRFPFELTQHINLHALSGYKKICLSYFLTLTTQHQIFVHQLQFLFSLTHQFLQTFFQGNP